VTAHPDAPAHSTPTSQPTLAAGQVGTLAQVPWAQIGPGWALVVYTTGNPATGTDIAGPVTLYMIDPEGGKYQIYQWPATTDPWSLIDWSPDKTRALLYDPQTSSTTLHQLTMATGQITTFTLPVATSQVVGYTRLDGENILVAQNGIVRYNLSGVPQKHLITAPNSGFLSALSSADGLTEVVNNGSGLELISNAGGVIRPLPVPGAQEYTCEPTRWWDSADVLVSCTPNGMMTEQLWVVPVSGSAYASRGD
jgi:TolB protein